MTGEARFRRYLLIRQVAQDRKRRQLAHRDRLVAATALVERIKAAEGRGK